MFKCKMCGGELEIKEGEKIVECPFCGSKQTIALSSDTNALRLFERGNNLRARGEYDLAISVFENLVVQHPEAEAYWDLLLCRYGIEYVNDFDGSKKPTMHRYSTDSILEDDDFKKVLELSDAVTRPIYQEQAERINRIQSQIAKIVANEKPYDIFICYKETGKDNQRTIDSVMAQEIYEHLLEKGFNVFFARITLEDKLGVEYEPYIYAALSSARVMLVVGTDPDYFNATWVKNEWSRFLMMMRKNRTKQLIPCYKNMDAYDLPQSFINLQGLDMGKIGWLQDLIHGIAKFFPEKESTGKQSKLDPMLEGFLTRAEALMMVGHFDEACKLLEREILLVDPKNERANIDRLLAQLKVSSLNEISEKCTVEQLEQADFQRAIEICNGVDKEKLLIIASELKKKEKYQQALQLISKYNIPKAKDLLKELADIGYKDAEQKLAFCNSFKNITEIEFGGTELFLTDSALYIGDSKYSKYPLQEKIQHARLELLFHGKPYLDCQLTKVKTLVFYINKNHIGVALVIEWTRKPGCPSSFQTAALSYEQYPPVCSFLLSLIEQAEKDKTFQVVDSYNLLESADIATEEDLINHCFHIQ